MSNFQDEALTYDVHFWEASEIKETTVMAAGTYLVVDGDKRYLVEVADPPAVIRGAAGIGIWFLLEDVITLREMAFKVNR